MAKSRLDEIKEAGSALMTERIGLDPADPVHKARLDEIEVTLKGLRAEEAALQDEAHRAHCVEELAAYLAEQFGGRVERLPKSRAAELLQVEKGASSILVGISDEALAVVVNAGRYLKVADFHRIAEDNELFGDGGNSPGDPIMITAAMVQ